MEDDPMPVSIEGQGYSKDDGGGSFYGGGYNAGHVTDREREAFDNLTAIAVYNRDTITGDLDKANTVYDIAEEQANLLAKKQYCDAAQKADGEWFAQHQRLQVVMHQINDQAGNLLTGSGMYDWFDLVAMKDDMDDVAVLVQFRENLETVYNQLANTIISITNSRNDAAREAHKALREIIADSAAQANNINPNLFEDPSVTNWPFVLPDLFNDNLRQAFKPLQEGLIRPDLAIDLVQAIYERSVYETAMSDNKAYNDAMLAGYSKNR